MVKTQTRADGLNVDSWYAWFGKAENDTIVFAYNYHRCGNSHSSGSHLGQRYKWLGLLTFQG